MSKYITDNIKIYSGEESFDVENSDRENYDEEIYNKG